jgi:lipopolysaccharide/colanic/teichoic acid biosynthesis glycosyltransferase
LASLSIVGEQYPSEASAWQWIGACERLGAAALLVVCLPVLAACALAVRILSGSSPFVAHRRVGWRGSELWMLKLRTMWGSGTPADGGRGWIEFIADDAGPARKQPADPRVSSGFARFCRRHSLDELPQLWHVIRGEMSLVGPRPLTAREIRAHYGTAAAEVLAVKPGIAGLWQTSGRNRLTYADRRRLDLHFVRSRSLGMYGRILLRVVPELWSGANTF